MKIDHIAATALKPSQYNPRKWDEKAISDLSASIRKYGLVDPIIVNSAPARRNIVIGGHFRLMVAKKLGYKKVPVFYISIPDIRKEKELNLRLNKNTGAWDKDLLAEFGKDLLSEVGFASEELDKIFQVDVQEDDFDAEKEYEKIKTPKTKRGDIYTLGRHKLMCGDSAQPAELQALMGKDKAQLIFTDPPYNVNYKSPGGLTYNSTKFGGTGGKMFNDNKSDADCLAFYTAVLKNLFEFSMKNATIYWWFANMNNWLNREAFFASGWRMSQIIIWLKNSMIFSMGQDYHRMYEPCMVGWKEKQKHYSNKQIANLKDVFNLDFTDFNEMLDVWYEKRDNTAEYVHPTQKPVRLAERGIKKNSQRGDIVLDAFGGSGSTLIACQQLERKAYLLELDPKYCDVIIKRYEKYTGKKAKKAA